LIGLVNKTTANALLIEEEEEECLNHKVVVAVESLRWLQSGSQI
jgi:hypothetical protein